MTSFTPVSAAAGGVLIGLAAVLLMGTTGRIAGVSGFVSRLLPPYDDDFLAARLAFVAGLVIAPLAYVFVARQAVEIAVTSNLPLLLGGGFLVGLGAVIGSGCTSGHGVCGIARLSPRGLVATGVFMATAVLTVYVVRHV